MVTLVRVAPWRVALGLAVMVCQSLTEGLGVLMLGPLLQLVGLDVGKGTLGRIAEFLTSVFAAVGARPTLIAVLGLYVLITSVQGLVGRWQTTISLTLQHEFVAVLRRRLYRAIASTTWPFFSRMRSSDFTHVLTTEVERVGGATYSLMHLFATAIVGIAYLAFALTLSAPMTGMVVASGGGLMLLLKRRTQVARTAGEGLAQAMSSLHGAVTEHIAGMKTAKSYGAEDRHAEIFAGLTERVQSMYIRAVRNQAEVKHWFDIGSVLLLSFILCVSVRILAVPTAQALLVLFLFTRIMPRCSDLQQSYQSFMNFLPAFASVMAMQARCEAATEPRVQGKERCELRHSVRLEQVSFGYEENGGAPVLRNLELSIRARETTAIVGPSGAGKSTVADLVMGLIVPDRGRLLVDGAPLSPARMGAWREQIGYVAQDTFLFHDTVRGNLLWARPEATTEEMRQALRLAAAGEFVSRLPEGLDTVLGDRGVLVSGGERQRLALARALLRRPSLLILDEATSSLDSENENRIQRAIETLRGDMTILVITHRLSTVRRADVIHVLDQGSLVESGTWDELFAREGGRFRALWTAQDIQSGFPAEAFYPVHAGLPG